MDDDTRLDELAEWLSSWITRNVPVGPHQTNALAHVTNAVTHAKAGIERGQEQRG